MEIVKAEFSLAADENDVYVVRLKITRPDGRVQYSLVPPRQIKEVYDRMIEYEGRGFTPANEYENT